MVVVVVRKENAGDWAGSLIGSSGFSLGVGLEREQGVSQKK